MPEIPDLEAIRHYLLPRVEGRLVERASAPIPWIVRTGVDGLERLIGRQFTAIERRGKFLLFSVDDGQVLVVNPMLTGRFHWVEAAEKKPGMLGVVIAFDDGHELRYSDQRRMGRWYLVDGAEALGTVPQMDRLGPDVLDVDEETFVALIRRRRGQVKSTLVNQEVVAGIGNAYSDEILWSAGLHPHRKGSTLDDDDRHSLYRAMRDVLEESIGIVGETVQLEGLGRKEVAATSEGAPPGRGTVSPMRRHDPQSDAGRQRDGLLRHLPAPLRIDALLTQTQSRLGAGAAMKVIGRDIGGVLDVMYAQLGARVQTEAERPLLTEPFEGGSFSNVEWRDDAVVIQLHNGVPTHALPHVLGVALQHVRQRLDLYPRVIAPVRQIQSGPLLRSALRELVMGPEAEMHLAPLELDTEWEIEQRHQGLKDLLRDSTAEWDRPSTVAFTFTALQFSRFTLEHPPELWEPLSDQFREKLPQAAERGTQVVAAVRKAGWKTPGACLESLVAARDMLSLQEYAAIEDRQRGQLL